MANLQVKGIDDGFYAELKRLAAEQNRSVSQQVILILREYLAKYHLVRRTSAPASVLLELAGSWEDERSADEIIAEIRKSRRSSKKLHRGL